MMMTTAPVANASPTTTTGKVCRVASMVFPIELTVCRPLHSRPSDVLARQCMSCGADLEASAYCQEEDVLVTYGMIVQRSEGANPRIAPLSHTFVC
jgi:hypothetical protein